MKTSFSVAASSMLLGLVANFSHGAKVVSPNMAELVRKAKKVDKATRQLDQNGEANGDGNGGLVTFQKCVSLSVEPDGEQENGGNDRNRYYWSQKSVVLFNYGYNGDESDDLFIVDLNTYMEHSLGSTCSNLEGELFQNMEGQDCEGQNEGENADGENGEEGDMQDCEENRENNERYEGIADQEWFMGYMCAQDGYNVQVEFFTDDTCTTFTSFMSAVYQEALQMAANSNNNQVANDDQAAEEEQPEEENQNLGEQYYQMTSDASAFANIQRYGRNCEDNCDFVDEALNVVTCQAADGQQQQQGDDGQDGNNQDEQPEYGYQLTQNQAEDDQSTCLVVQNLLGISADGTIDYDNVDELDNETLGAKTKAVISNLSKLSRSEIIAISVVAAAVVLASALAIYMRCKKKSATSNGSKSEPFVYNRYTKDMD